MKLKICANFLCKGDLKVLEQLFEKLSLGCRSLAINRRERTRHIALDGSHGDDLAGCVERTSPPV